MGDMDLTVDTPPDMVMADMEDTAIMAKDLLNLAMVDMDMEGTVMVDMEAMATMVRYYISTKECRC